MDIQRFEQEQLMVEISDMIPGIKRKALFRRLEFSEEAITNSGPRGMTTIYLTIQHFTATEENGYGEPYQSKAIRDYDYTISAHGLDLVDATNGQFLKQVSEVTDADSEEGGILFGKTVMYDNEFYRYVSYNAPVKVMELITAVIQAHALNNKFPK